MAKKGTKETSLFNGHRRKLKFKGGAHVFLDPQGNKHTRLQVELALTGEPLLGMPEFASSAYMSMQKDTSAEASTDFSTYMHGISVAVFNGPTQKTKQMRLTGCELDKFVIKKEGVGENVKIALHFQIDVLGHKELYDYMWDHHNAPIHVEFDFNQNDIRFPEKKDEEDEEDASGDEATNAAENKNLENSKNKTKLM